jgi:hypothetical protein
LAGEVQDNPEPSGRGRHNCSTYPDLVGPQQHEVPEAGIVAEALGGKLAAPDTLVDIEIVERRMVAVASVAAGIVAAEDTDKAPVALGKAEVGIGLGKLDLHNLAEEGHTEPTAHSWLLRMQTLCLLYLSFTYSIALVEV